MITNTDVTLYRCVYDASARFDRWEREYIPKAWWFKAESSSVDAEGLHRADSIVVRIPDISVQIKKEDMLVKGECDIEVTRPSDLDGVESIKVMAVNYNDFGNTPHIKVGGQ